MARIPKKKITEPEVVETVEEVIQVPVAKEIVQVPVVEEPIVELTPKFAEAEEKKIQEVDKAEQNQEVIKTLRVKLENGTISDGEAQRLFALLSDK